jgi:AcrR family transcriptional regulator
MENITVKEICNLADINRATFYRNYADLYALYDAIEEDLVAEAFADRDMDFCVLDFLRLIQENKAFYRELFRRTKVSTGSVRLIDQFGIKMRERMSLRLKAEDYEVYLRYVAYGIGGLLRDWLESDCGMDVVPLAAQIERIVVG